MIKYISELAFLIFFVSLANPLTGQTNHAKGLDYFNRRAENSKGLNAKKKYINRSIKYFEKETSPESIALLLRAYEFKGTFVRLSKKKRKEVYELAIEVGKQAMDDYPDHIGIKYFYVANLGRYGQTISKISAHQKGITDEIRNLIMEIIEQNPQFAEAGAMRILGAIHLKVPSIPLILTWPSEEKALDLLSEAYELAPDNPANARLYAEALLEDERLNEAKAMLLGLLNDSPRDSSYLEDKKALLAAKEVYEKHFK